MPIIRKSFFTFIEDDPVDGKSAGAAQSGEPRRKPEGSAQEGGSIAALSGGRAGLDDTRTKSGPRMEGQVRCIVQSPVAGRAYRVHGLRASSAGYSFVRLGSGRAFLSQREP
jgi:hypothetical protein